MAEFDDFNFNKSSDEGEFEGFIPDDVIKAIEKGAQLRQINDGELSDISFDEDDDDDEQIKKNGLNKTKHNKGEKELLYFLYIYKLRYNMKIIITTK
jgi:hypothetical protein